MACGTSKLTQNIGSTICVRPGGFDKKAWAFNKDDFSGRVFNATTKSLEDFVIAVGKKGYSAVGRKDKNTAGATVVLGDSGPTFNHSVSLKFYHDTQLERLAITEFIAGPTLKGSDEMATGRSA